MVESESQTKIAEAVLDMPLRGQCIISLDGQSFLLSISSSVGEKDLYKIWVQDPVAIKVDDSGPVEPYNQLIFRGNDISNTKIVLDEKHGYEEIEKGTELEFLGHLLSDGYQSWIE